MKKMLLLTKNDSNLKEYITNQCDFAFDYVLEIDSKSNVETVLNKIKGYDEIYFLNFSFIFRKILPFISFSKKCNSIFSYEISELTDRKILEVYNSIIEFYDREIFKEIHVLSSEVYKVLNNSKYNCSLIKFDIKNINLKEKEKKEKVVIGVLNDDFNPNNNFYNVLTALTMVNVSKIKLVCTMDATKEFIYRFNLPVEYCSSINDVLDEDNTLNIYTNFTSNKYYILKKSMDQNVPCIIGNFDETIRNKYDKSLIIQSDDDVNELSSVINKYIN